LRIGDGDVVPRMMFGYFHAIGLEVMCRVEDKLERRKNEHVIFVTGD